MANMPTLITGAGGGIGHGIALTFARAGNPVVLGDLNLAAAEEVAEEVRAEGGEAIAVQLDVSSEASVAAFVAAGSAAFGALKAAINVAGIQDPDERTPLHEYTLEQWNRVVGVNLTGVWLSMKHELTHFMANGGGSVVNIASVMGLASGLGRVNYVAAKHGVVGLTRAAAVEYAAEGIRANAVCPGPVLTPLLQVSMDRELDGATRYNEMSPAKRPGTPDEIGQACLFLASPEASYVNGVIMQVDGGCMASSGFGSGESMFSERRRALATPQDV